MSPTKRIIVNTLAQYTRSILNIGLSLYSTRLILAALNISDYGIYVVVAGVVTMLGFITNALVITTQRYISFYHGQGEQAYVKKLFTNSLFLHVLFGLAISAVLVSLKWWLFDELLNIDPLRIETAGKVYFITIFMLFTTIITAPFKALFIARENIVYVSFVDICDGIIKLMMAIALAYVTAEKLLVYAMMMASIQVLNLLAYSLFARYRFPECSLFIHRRDIDRRTMGQLIGFAGWTTFAAGTVAARTQGISVIFNHFLGTVANAAYGISAQVNNAIMFVSSSVVNAMNPQIMKAEGESDRQRMLFLAGQESKYAALLLSIVAIPMISELPAVLDVWLKEVPPMSVMFCTFTLITCLADLFTIGLNTANQAQGHIGPFTLITYIPKLLNIPVAWMLMARGYSAEMVMWSILLVEIAVSIVRVPYLWHTAGLDMKEYARQTVLPLLPLIGMLIVASWGLKSLFHFHLSFLLTIPLAMMAGLATAWAFSLNKGEHDYILQLFRKKIEH